MKKNLIKITAAAFAATMAFGTTGLMAYADEDGAAVETPIVIEKSLETPAEEAPIAEAPTNAPADTPAEEPTLTEVPYTGEPTEETPTEAVETPTEEPTEIPTEELTVTTVTTEVAVIETQTTTAVTEEAAQATTTMNNQSQQLLTSGSWRSNKGDYTFDASRPSGVITIGGNQTNFTYNVSGSTVTMNYGSTPMTGTFSIASADNFTISWSDGTVETFTRQASQTGNTTTTTTKTSSSSTSTTKSSSSSKSSSSAPAGKTDSPKTGDDFHALPIAALALTGAAVCFISFRKREND